MGKKFLLGLAIAEQILGNYRTNLDTVREFAGEVVKKGAEILIFPEMNLTGYPVTREHLEKVSLPLEKVLADLFQLSAKYKLVLVCGFAERAGSHFFITQLVAGPSGLIAAYRKIHLGPPERSLFTAGNDPILFNACGTDFGLQLCYDAHFAELSTYLALSGAKILLFPHASPRGTSEEKKESWMRHLPGRAYDTGSYVFSVNPVGPDGSGKDFPGLALGFGPDGKLIAEFLDTKPGLLVCEVDPEKAVSVRSHVMTAFHLARRPDLYKKFFSGL